MPLLSDSLLSTQTMPSQTRDRLPWSPPRETIAAEDVLDAVEFGSMEPLPTDMASPMELLRRDELSNTCGFSYTNNIIPLTCRDVQATCVKALAWAKTDGFAGCCETRGRNCDDQIATACFNAKDSPKTCSDRGLCCTQSTNTECNAWTIFTDSPSTSNQIRYTLFNCGPTATSGTLVEQTSNLGLPPVTYTDNGHTSVGYQVDATKPTVSLLPVGLVANKTYPASLTIGLPAGLLGGTAVLALVGLAAVYCRRRASRGKAQSTFSPPKDGRGGDGGTETKTGFFSRLPWRGAKKRADGDSSAGAGTGSFRVLRTGPAFQYEQYEEHDTMEQRLLAAEQAEQADAAAGGGHPRSSVDPATGWGGPPPARGEDSDPEGYPMVDQTHLLHADERPSSLYDPPLPRDPSPASTSLYDPGAAAAGAAVPTLRSALRAPEPVELGPGPRGVQEK